MNDVIKMPHSYVFVLCTFHSRRSIEAISSQQAAMSTSGVNIHNGAPQQWFLHQLSRYQQHLSKMYNERQPPNDRGKPLVASISGLELGDDHDTLRTNFKDCDVSRFIIPTSLLVRNNMNPSHGTKAPPPHSAAAGSILPLLRCVGVGHAIRILAALLSERRVVLSSYSPTRLAACSHSAVSALAVGLLHWQHLYIPVLPPHLWQYLAAPYPYLIGILSNTVPRLDRTDGLGEVLLINLDTNQMETRGMDTNTILQRLPDLFQSNPDPLQNQLQNSRPYTASEELGRDLSEILKEDKKVLYGESALNKVSEKAAVATKAVKQTFLKLRDKGRQYLQNRMQSGNVYDETQASPQEANVGDDDGPSEVNIMTTDYVYTESCQNETAEQEVRIAFTSFFLSLLGDMKWYLSQLPGQQVPIFDRNKFLQTRRSMGDGDGTAMWVLLNNCCQTQMLEEFTKARINEVMSRAVITPDMPLFLQCAAQCRQHNLDFNLVTCRRITRQIADGSSARLTGLIQTNARRTAMTLTSNKAFEGDYEHAIAKLVEESRESTSILFDIMSVIWLRLRDCKGMQWKHGHHALQLLRNILYHGPLAAISEATDGLSKIQALKYYDNIRAQHAQEIRSSAVLVYDLLVDRAKLFHIRRVCANRRRLLQSRAEPKVSFPLSYLVSQRWTRTNDIEKMIRCIGIASPRRKCQHSFTIS
jgi:DENN (AEX-3) domain/ENTH domain